MDVLYKPTKLEKNGHIINLPKGLSLFENNEKVVIYPKYGSVYISFKEYTVEIEVHFHDGYAASFIFNQSDKAEIDLKFSKMQILFNHAVHITKKDRNMQTSFLTLHLLPLTPMDPEYKDGRKYYTVQDQKPSRNAAKPKKGKAKQESKPIIDNIFEHFDADISMEAAFNAI